MESFQFLFLLITTILVVIMTAVFAYNVYVSGKFARRYKGVYTTKRHKKWVDAYLLTVVIAVLLIELTLIVNRRDLFEIRLTETVLGQIHGLLDIFFVCMVIAVRWLITGDDNPKLHRLLAKITLATYVLILGTGAWLTIRLVFPS